MDSKDQAAIHLAAAMSGADINDVVDGIGRASQSEMAYSQKFPKKMDGEKEKFEALGFKFGPEIDRLFVQATFPEGWKIVPTSHYMWSDLLDDKGRKRGSIFYKPDFWDQDAFARLNRRYHGRVERDYEWREAHEEEYADIRDLYQDQPHTGMIVDHDGTVLWSHGPTTAKAEGIPWPEFDDAFRKMVDDLLTKRFPDHEDVLAYWD